MRRAAGDVGRAASPTSGSTTRRIDIDRLTLGGRSPAGRRRSRLDRRRSCPRAASASRGGRQTVAIIDSGIAYDHVALGGGLGKAYRVVGGWDFAENDANPYDDGPAGFHGTHVAGIVGAQDCALRGRRVRRSIWSPCASSTTRATGQFTWVESALRWVHQHRNAFENPITTVNLSLGTDWNASTLPNWATFEDELKQLAADGIFISRRGGQFVPRL